MNGGRIAGGFFILLVLGGHFAASVQAQPALERLERQIRQRVDTPGAEKEEGAPPPPILSTESGNAKDASKAAYLGVVADDQKDRGRGVRVLDVHRGSPAEKAGLKKQDLITSLAGTRVRQMTDMAEVLESLKPGEKAEFEIQREGKTEKIEVTLGERPALNPSAFPTPEAVPLPKGEPMVEPQEPPELKEPAPPADPAARVAQLERRVAELEGRVAELQRQLTEIAKKQKNAEP